MAFQSVANTVSCFMEYGMPTSDVAGNVINVIDDLAGVTAPRVQELADLLVTFSQTATARAARSNEVLFQRVTARDLTVEFGQVVDQIVNPAVTGTVASTAVPAHTTLSVKFGTGLAGRSARGRAYHVGLAEAQVSQDYVTGAAATAILAFWTLLRTTLIAADFQLAVVQRTSDGVKLPVGIARPVTVVTLVDTRVDTQRRRLAGSGN